MKFALTQMGFWNIIAITIRQFRMSEKVGVSVWRTIRVTSLFYQVGRVKDHEKICCVVCFVES